MCFTSHALTVSSCRSAGIVDKRPDDLMSQHDWFHAAFVHCVTVAICILYCYGSDMFYRLEI
jgi:hypothetical protein